MTQEQYWGALKAAGITAGGRLTQRSFFATNRHGEKFTVADPATLTPTERQAAADWTTSLYS